MIIKDEKKLNNSIITRELMQKILGNNTIQTISWTSLPAFSIIILTVLVINTIQDFPVEAAPQLPAIPISVDNLDEIFDNLLEARQMLQEGNITKADLYLDNIERIFLLYNTSLIEYSDFTTSLALPENATKENMPES
jgi:hypothetical protein